MKKLAILIISVFVCATSIFLQKKGGVPDTSKHSTFYTCPMHKDIKELKAGDCPKCFGRPFSDS